MAGAEARAGSHSGDDRNSRHCACHAALGRNHGTAIRNDNGNASMSRMQSAGTKMQCGWALALMGCMRHSLVHEAHSSARPVVLELGEVFEVAAGGAPRVRRAAVPRHPPQQQHHRLQHIHLHMWMCFGVKTRACRKLCTVPLLNPGTLPRHSLSPGVAE